MVTVDFYCEYPALWCKSAKITAIYAENRAWHQLQCYSTLAQLSTYAVLLLARFHALKIYAEMSKCTSSRVSKMSSFLGGGGT